MNQTVRTYFRFVLQKRLTLKPLKAMFCKGFHQFKKKSTIVLDKKKLYFQI